MIDDKTNKTFEEVGKFIFEIMNKVSKTFSEITSHIDWSKINDPLIELGKVLKETGDDLIKFKTITVELGYPPHSDISIPIIRKVVKDYDDYGKDYVSKYIDEIMFELYDENFMYKISKDWSRKQILKPIIPILNDVIKAHNQQMYYSSVSTLLPQLEGTIARAFKHEGELKGIHLKVYLKTLLINKNEETRFFSFDEALHDFYLKYILVRFQHGDELHSDISRHAILHGGHTQFGTKQNSLKLILLFDYLSKCLGKIDGNLIKEAKLEITSKN